MAKETKVKDIDITKSGPMTFRDLQEANQKPYTNLSPEFQSFSMNVEANTAPTSLYDARAHGEQMVATSLGGTATPWGESMFDKSTATEAQFQELGDIRANNQPWYAQIGAGLAKGAVLAGTTFLDGIIGLILGIGEAARRGFDDNYTKSGAIAGLWDNDFSKAMQSINEWSEEVLPNYYTKAEQEQPWYENIFTANFLGDKVIKNLGFTIGAYYSGGVTAAGLKVTKLPQLIGAIAKSSKAPAIVSSAVGATVSAVNEGRIEALNNSKDWFELHKAQLDDSLRERLNIIQAEYEANAGKQLIKSSPEGDFIDPAYIKYQEDLKKEKDNYDQALSKLSEDRLKMGNADLLMNLPILTTSNIIQFGKLYANGFKTARKATNIVGKAGKYTAGTTRLGATAAITKGALSEGTEEITQGMASRISGNYYSTDVNNFYKSKTDPDTTQETLSWIKSFAEGINETVNDSSAWEEFFIGTLTGALGMPRFRGIKNESGSFQSPITIEGGAINEWREYREQMARENEIANYMNNRINSPEFKNYYQGLVRHNKYQNDMNQAAEQGDEFNFKNAEHAQLVSDIAMFDNAGKIEDLYTLIDMAVSDFSDEELASIVENTTRNITRDEQINNLKGQAKSIQTQIDELSSNIESLEKYLKGYKKKHPVRDIRGKFSTEDENRNASGREHIAFTRENIAKRKKELDNLNRQLNLIQEQINKVSDKKVGPFIDESGNPMYATPEGKQKMITKLTENKSEITKAIDNYLKIKDDLDIRTGQQLSDEQLEELTWMKSQIGNWSDRAIAMSGDVKSTISSVMGNLDALLKFNEQIRDLEGRFHVERTDRYEQVDENVRTIQGAINTLNFVRNQDDKALAYTLATNPKFVDGLIEEINKVDETVLSEDEKQDIITKLNDIVKLGNATKTYNAKLKEYLENPQKQVEDHTKADEQAIQKEAKKKSDDLKTSLKQASNLKDFRTIIDNQDDTENRDKVLKEMEDEGNAMAKTYRETSQYNAEVSRLIQASDAEPQTKQDAMKLLQDQFNNSENLEQLANPNSIYVNNENAFDEDSNDDAELSATRFQNAQYELQKAISKVNNDNRFKDRFSPEYKKPVEKREGHTKGDDRTTTGDSGTTTIPPVGTSTLPIVEIPIGNVTPEMVADENKKANEKADTPQKPEGNNLSRFYRPAIPELHIEASKEGDFRPFVDVVAEREKNADFSDIYNYLRDKGAFEYLNQGKLKVGDEIGFMIDPEFEERVKDKEWHKAPTIFMIDKKSGQIVGSLDESDYSASRYEGLKNLEEKIRKEYADRENKTGKFVATPTTKVSKMMVGRVPYGNTEKSLKDIPNVSGENKAPIFGIIKNGVLTTNGKIDDSLIIKPVDMAQKEGRLYLLIPNGAGKYSPVAVRVKHFNNEEFNLDDGTIANTPIGKDISAAITKLANATSQDDVSQAMQDLAQDLYMQDVMVTWFNGKAGSGIVISKKVRKPDGTYEKVIIDGKEQIKEDKYDVYFSTSGKSVEIGGVNFDVTASEELGDTSALGVSKDPNDIYKEILEHLIKFNLPLQVGAKRINNGAYNNRLINSNILTSNITDASVRGTWFTTDYFDNEGNLHQAISPASVAPQPKRKVETPVGGTEGAITGTKITSVFSNKTYYVDLKTNTIKDDQGKSVEIANDNRILFDLAWAQDNFGNSTNSTIMVDNKVLTPSGQVLDRTTQKYITGREAQDVKDAIAGREKEKEDRVAKSKEVIDEIYENQKKVDKTRTDGEFYYVLEDDGQYHEYSRVHSRLGSNWIESPKQTEALTQIKTKLSQLVDNPTQYNNYLKFLENKYNVNLEDYQGKTDAKSRDAIVTTVRDLMSGTNSMRALNAGTAVDSVIRQYFTIRDVSKIVRPDNMTEKAFIDLITNLNRIKSNMEQMGERFLADNIVLFQKYPDGTRVAGEVDILSVDKDGNFKIYDVKTSRYSFDEFTDSYGHKVNYFTTPSATQRMSAKDYYTLQLSAYKNLFESQYGVPVTKLAIIPFVLSYDKKDVSSVQSEKGIPITYNPAVNVPLVGNVKVDKPVKTPTIPAQESPLLPIYDSSLELQNPIENLTPEHKSTDKDKVGYFELDGKLHKGYITPLITINGIEVYFTKIPNITKGFGRQEETAHVASNSYYAVFPNGKTFLAIKNNPVQGGYSQEQVEQAIAKMLEGNPQRVKDMSNEKTILFDPNAKPISIKPNTKPIKNGTLPNNYDYKEDVSIAENTSFSDIDYSEARKAKKLTLNDARGKKSISNPIHITSTIEIIDNKVKVKVVINYAEDYWIPIEATITGELAKNYIAAEGDRKEALNSWNKLGMDKGRDEYMRGVEALVSTRKAGIIRTIIEKLETPTPNIETPATVSQSTPQTGAAYTAQKEQAIMEHDDEFDDEFTLRRVDETVEIPVWNQEEELKWLNRVLPQLSEQDRVKIVKGLIKVGKKGTLAWGQFDKGVITLSDIAAEGTTYHEAFHVVFNLLLDQSERHALYDEARKIYGNKDNLSLEEAMAEGFREYVMARQNRGLGRKILDFFKELFTKVTHWDDFRPSLTSYYQRINEGKYANSNFKVSTISELRGVTPNTTTFNSLSESIRENLTKKGWTAEKFDSISQDERDQAIKCIAF